MGRVIERVIHKYELEPLEEKVLVLPVGSVVVYVGNQLGKLMMWVQKPVAFETICVERKFFVFGTGHKIIGCSNHIGSVIMNHGDLVWHIYETE